MTLFRRLPVMTVGRRRTSTWLARLLCPAATPVSVGAREENGAEQVTRDHVDIDWEAWIDDAPAITAALHADGYCTIKRPPPDHQLDVALQELERPAS